MSEACTYGDRSPPAPSCDSRTINLSRRFRWLAIGLLVNLVILGGISYWVTYLLSRQLDAAEHVDLPSVRHAGLIGAYHGRIRANAFHAMIISSSKNQEEIQEVRQEAVEFAANIASELDGLGKLELADTIRSRIPAVKENVVKYSKYGQEMVELALAGKLHEVIRLLPAFQEHFESLEKELGALNDLILDETAQSARTGERLIQMSSRVSVGVLIVGLLFGAIGSWTTLRVLERALRGMVERLTRESTTMGATANSLNTSAAALSSSTQKQASAIQETAASVDEITAMVKKTEEGAVQLRDSSRQSQESAADGQRAVEQVISAIGAIGEGNARVMEQVEGGNRQLAEIVKVISEIESKTKVINDIVFQTKLLSFNASVEAARAGEHGRGFAVVAEEVGNLAQMSGNAAKEISELLSSSVQKVNGIIEDSRRKVDGLVAESKSQVDVGMTVSKQCGAALTQIVKQASNVGSMVSDITTAIQEQTQGIEEISKAIGSLDRSTHENSATSSATSTNASSLLAQAQTLQEIVSTLAAMSGLKNQAESPSEAPAAADEQSTDDAFRQAA